MKFHDIDLLNILSSKTKRKVVDFMLNHTASMSEREIASILKVSHMSVNRTMHQLAKLNLVNYTTIGKSHMWKVNRKSYTYKILTQAGKNGLAISVPLESLKTSLITHTPKALVKKIILFGSIAKGVEKVNSDIDVFIVVKNEINKAKLEPYIEKLIDICLENYGNRLAPYVLTEQELKTKKNLAILTEINRGIEIFPKKKDEK